MARESFGGVRMSTTYSITINGLDAQVQIGNGYETSGAATIVFDDDANIVAETEFTRYSGYCTAEIVYLELDKTLTTRRGIESHDVANAVLVLGLECTCDDDD